MTQATAPILDKRTDQTTAAPRRRTPLHFVICQTLVVSILVLAALEFTFALAGIGEEEYMRPDPLMGADGIPNKSVTWRKEGYARLRYNSSGMQDNERSITKPAGTLRIACLGDSLLEALQVDRELNFCSVLEHKLSRTTGKSWEVLNFGVSNSNLGQMYLRLKTKVWKFEPDVVAICIRPDAVYQLAPNAQQGFITSRPTFFLGPNQTLIQDMTVQRLWERSREGKRMRATSWLREHSRTWGVISKGVEQFTGWLEQLKSGTVHWGADVTEKQTAFKPVAAPPATAAKIDSTPKKANTKSTTTATVSDPGKSHYDKATMFFWPVMNRLIQEIKNECDAHGAKLVIVRLPAYDGWCNKLETQLLQRSAEEHGAIFINTQEQFASAAKSQQLFFNAHMRPSGHKIVADAMLKKLTIP